MDGFWGMSKISKVECQKGGINYKGGIRPFYALCTIFIFILLIGIKLNETPNYNFGPDLHHKMSCGNNSRKA